MSRREPRWVTRIVVEAVHVDQIREHGGLIGLRDDSALESALARPRHKWNYDPDADLADLAPAYAFGICTSHPFRDGNKRVAFLTAVVFLGLNGLAFTADDSDVVDAIVALAAGDLAEASLADWYRRRTSPREE